MIELPNIECRTADGLVGVFDEDELMCAIAYLELVYTERLIPGPELFRLGISPLEYTDQELWAVQNRCALGIQKMQAKRANRQEALMELVGHRRYRQTA